MGGEALYALAPCWTLEILLVLGLVLLNGVLAMSELAIVSSRPGRLKAMRDRGVPGARTALMLAESPGRFLSTVQVGITLVGIWLAPFRVPRWGTGCPTGSRRSGMPADYAEPLGFILVVAAITYISLVIGETGAEAGGTEESGGHRLPRGSHHERAVALSRPPSSGCSMDRAAF